MGVDDDEACAEVFEEAIKKTVPKLEVFEKV